MYMRNILLSTTACIAALLCNSTYIYAAWEGKVCDQNFTTQYIREWKSYLFGDKYKNLNDYNHWLSDFSYDFLADDNFNNWPAPKFDWTPNFLSGDPVISGGVQKEVITSSIYTVAKKPSIRDSIADIFLVYDIEYYGDPAWNNSYSNGPDHHTECQPYIITWCGDGVVDTPNAGASWSAETCDDGANNGKPGYCNASCNGKVVQSPVCWTSVGTLTSTISSTSSNLCTIWSVNSFNSTSSWNTQNFAWSCTNTSGNQSCTASYTPPPFCGNNIKEGTESCDGTDGVPAGKMCTSTCTLTDIPPPPPQCWTSVGTLTSTISSTSSNLCTIWSVNSFNSTSSWNTQNFAWSCKNTSGAQSCAANYTPPPQCWNNIKEGTESCDGTDGVPAGKMCTNTCTLTDLVCVENFTGSLRYGQTVKFGDSFTNPTWSTIALKSFVSTFVSQYDYNLSEPTPVFDWASWLNFNVPAGTSNQKIISSNDYRILAVPAIRSFENLRINFDVKYQIGSLPEVTHRECAKYEITWCGDGILDTNIDTDLVTPGVQGEQCDPNDPSRAWWGSGGCNATSCKPITTPDSFNLSLKKYVDTVAVENDAQNNSGAIEKTNSATFSYKVVVTNNGPSSVSGITTVTDTLPEGVSFSGNVTGTTWSCSQATNNFTCTNSGAIPSGSAFQVINIPVVTSASASGYINNTATVSNPGDTNISDNTDPAVIHISSTPISQGTLSIKKYAGTMPAGDSQTEPTAVGVSRGAEFNYLYRVTVSSGSVNGAIVRDALPEYVEFVRFGSTPAGWSTGSTTTTHSGHLHTVVMHQTDSILPSGSSYDFTIVARLRADAVGQYHQNIAYVCPKKILSGGSLIDNPACTTTVPPLPPDTGCSTLPNPPFMDPACIKANDGFDLSIRKYINSDDAETAISLAGWTTFNYRMIVTNNGPVVVNGTTFVSDAFPAGVERTVWAITGTGWNCSASSGSTLSCYSIQTITAGGAFPEIVVPMRVTAGDNTTVTNTVCVTNANESAAKTLAGGDTTNCNSAVLKTGCTGSCWGGSQLQCISVAKINSTTFACQGNSQARSFWVDRDGDNVIDYTGDFSHGNPASFPVNPDRPGSQNIKCIVSNHPVFPIVVGHNYNTEYSNYPSSLDTNDTTCKITNTISNPYCGNGTIEIGETCDMWSAVNWGACGQPGTFNQCKTGGTSSLVCGNGRLDVGEECDPSVYASDPSKWWYCGKPLSSSQIVTTRTYDVCNGVYVDRFKTPGECKIGLDISTQPMSCTLPSITINPAESPSREFTLFNGQNITWSGTYSMIIGQNTPVFRQKDKLNLRSPGYIFSPPPGSKIVLKSQWDFITNDAWSQTLNQSCIGNANPWDQPNQFNSRWNGSTWELCEPLMNFSDFDNNSARLNQHKWLSIVNWPSDSNRWNDAWKTDYGQTNNLKNAAYRTVNDPNSPFLDFYVTLQQPGDDIDNDMRLPGAINIRVTRPIIANNAGGAGYFANPNQTVDIDTVAKDFLEQLRATNFNTGKAQNPSGSSTSFNLDSIAGASVTSTGTALPITGNAVALTSKQNIELSGSSWLGINSKRTYVINGTLTINRDIDTNNNSVAFIANEIKIGSGVTRLDGIYIANSIKWVSGWSQLIVNGSLYGDASELIKARTYARGSSASSGIVTGILVNYSSRVLSDPPPLVSDFLKQYNLTKVTSVQ